MARDIQPQVKKPACANLPLEIRNRPLYVTDAITNQLESLTMAYNVAVIIGSLRKDSFTRKVFNAAAKLAPASLKFEVVEIGNLPIFNQDTEAGDAAVKAFRDKIAAADAVLFATPEHNRSVPAALKNALDWVPVRGARASGAASPQPSSRPRSATSPASAPTTTCAR